jgi:outer membrane receptor protein involved in Fe transport
VLGGRVQSGEFQSQSRVYNPAFANPAADTRATENFFRGSAYGYYTVELPTHLRLTAGVAYDAITFPENFRAPPITAGEDSRHQLSPKAALVWAPVDPLTVRAIYTRSLGGASFDESYRLEPTQLAGFPQSFRTIISESVVGSVAAPEFETAGAAMDFKLPAATYAGVQFERLASQVRQTIGTLEYDTLGGSSSVGSTRQHFDYEETRLSIHVGKLLGHEWSIGAQYRFTSSELQQRLPEIPAVQPDARVLDHAELHNVTSFLLFNHASGFFSRVESQWYWQDWSHTTAGNTGLKTTSSFGDSFFQVNLLAGFRFPRQRGEVSAGVLNLNGADYQLFPLTPYSELPRERVLVARLRLNF